MKCDKDFLAKIAVSFLFLVRFWNGLNRAEGLIFLD